MFNYIKNFIIMFLKKENRPKIRPDLMHLSREQRLNVAVQVYNKDIYRVNELEDEIRVLEEGFTNSKTKIKNMKYQMNCIKETIRERVESCGFWLQEIEEYESKRY